MVEKKRKSFVKRMVALILGVILAIPKSPP